MTFKKWFETFLAEKDLPFVSWEIKDRNGEVNFIDSDVVVEHILIAPEDEQSKIKDVIVKIDFANGDVNHFFKHLATALIYQR